MHAAHQTPSYIPYKAKFKKPWTKWNTSKLSAAAMRKLADQQILKDGDSKYYEQSFTQVNIPNTILSSGVSTQFMLPCTGDGSGALALQQGVTFNQRIGNKVHGTSLHAHGQIAVDPKVIGGYDTGTISIIWDKRPNGGGFPGVTAGSTNVCTFSNTAPQDSAIFDDFSSSTPSNNVQGNIFMNSVIQGDRFITLRKFDYTVNADGPQTVPFDLYVKLKGDQCDTRWGLPSVGVTIPTVSKNTFYLIARSVNGSSICTGQFRFSYVN